MEDWLKCQKSSLVKYRQNQTIKSATGTGYNYTHEYKEVNAKTVGTPL